MLTKATDLLYSFYVQKRQYNKELLITTMLAQKPNILSIVMERTCNLQCKHCIYKKETSSAAYKDNLKDAALLLVQKMPDASYILHEGRILSRWHIDILTQIRVKRPDLKIGIIDNGTYTNHIAYLKKKNLTFDWMDISIDGMKEAHNKQRANKMSFDETINGFENAQQVTTQKANALFTLTNINYKDIKCLGHFLLNKYAKEFYITPMSEDRIQLKPLNTNQKQFSVATQQIKELQKEFKDKVHMKIYNIKHLRLLYNIDKQAFKKAVLQAKISEVAFKLNINNLKVYYFPKSLWPMQNYLLDADGYIKVACMQKYTLEELQKHPEYMVGKVSKDMSISKMYLNIVKKWRDHFFEKEADKEKEFFEEVFAK